ncbi:MAG: hypothetical protein Q9162_001269 [Coniocarpon cinnabarinum]
MPNQYTASHDFAVQRGPGDARPTADQIVRDENLVDAWLGRHAVVTGTSSGIGVPTVGALALTGATVFATARNTKKAQEALKDLLPGGKDERKGKVVIVEMENGSLTSVRKAAQHILQQSGGKVNTLIGNAGIMECPEGKTEDGFELQFGTNHLGHFLLFQLLKDAMLKAAKEDGDARVVLVSSMGHKYGNVRFDDYGFEKDTYTPGAAYGQSKLANVYMANQITHLYGPHGLNGFSLNPGGIWTGLQAHWPEGQKEGYEAIEQVRNYMKSWEQGAATSIWGATAKALKGRGGLYLEDCDIAMHEKDYPDMGAIEFLGYNDSAFNPEGEARLWEDSLKMVGLK